MGMADHATCAPAMTLRSNCNHTSIMQQRPAGKSWLAAFLQSQHVVPGSKFSSFLLGESVIKKESERRPKSRRAMINKKKIEMVPGSSVHLDGYMMDRGVADQSNAVHSPTNFSRPLTVEKPPSSAPLYVHPAFESPCATPSQHKVPTRAQREATEQSPHPRRHGSSKTQKRAARIKCKGIGTCVSGTVLAVVLTVYLAMATANAVPTTAFHVTFIFCIIVLTIVFAHFLIRLCMLTLQSRPAYARHQPLVRKRRHHDHKLADLESGLLRPPSTTNAPHVDQLSQRTTTIDQTAASAPPAYGWWRGSVRIDPEEVRYFDPDQSELHQRTRSLVFAGSGQRPPSYTSDPLEVVIDRPEPLFHRPNQEAIPPVVREV